MDATRKGDRTGEFSTFWIFRRAEEPGMKCQNQKPCQHEKGDENEAQGDGLLTLNPDF